MILLKAISLFLLIHAFPADASSSEIRIDRESMECVSCHKTSLKPQGSHLFACHEEGCTHPIGVDYASASKTRAGFIDPERLDPAIRLPDGKIGCLACHEKYEKKEHEKRSGQGEKGRKTPLLVMDNEGSRLCLSCHAK